MKARNFGRSDAVKGRRSPGPIFTFSSRQSYDFFRPLRVSCQTEVPVVTMIKIEALIHPFQLDEVKAELERLGCESIAVSKVFFNGGPNEMKSRYRGCEYRAGVPKIKLEILLSSHRVDGAIDVLSRAAGADKHSDDRTILVYEISDAIRIRDGRRVEFSLS